MIAGRLFLFIDTAADIPFHMGVFSSVPRDGWDQLTYFIDCRGGLDKQRSVRHSVLVSTYLL